MLFVQRQVKGPLPEWKAAPKVPESFPSIGRVAFSMGEPPPLSPRPKTRGTPCRSCPKNPVRPHPTGPPAPPPRHRSDPERRRPAPRWRGGGRRRRRCGRGCRTTPRLWGSWTSSAARHTSGASSPRSAPPTPSASGPCPGPPQRVNGNIKKTPAERGSPPTSKSAHYPRHDALGESRRWPLGRPLVPIRFAPLRPGAKG